MRGFWKTMESVFAVMLIMGFLVTAGGVYTSGGDDAPAPAGRAILKALDDAGELRPLADAKNYSAINSMVNAPGFGHSVRICDFSGSCWGNYTAANATGNVAASSYMIAGYGSYEPLEIRLYMWRAE